MIGNAPRTSMFSPVRIGAAIAGVFFLLAVFVIPPQLFENLEANHVMVIQSPVDGTLNCYTNPGMQWQGMGKVTTYPRRGAYSFDNAKEDNSKKLRFNDGGHANLYGSVNWEMPLDCKSIIELHKNFGSAEGIQAQAVAKMVDIAIYLSGPMMSSTESSGERRAELVQLINDQAQHGVYRMVTKTVLRADPITGEKREYATVEIVRDAAGNPLRQQGSILEQFHITLLPISVTDIRYDSVVEKQIAQRQEATTQVQIAQANARRAEQDAITAAKQGEANAAKARWEQETIKAKEVTKAQQSLEVATLGAREAEQYKKEQILRGEGEAARKQLVMSADGALDQKLEAYKQVNKVWADAFSKFGGAMVPAVQMGGANGATAMASAQSLVDMLTAKTARDLSIDLSTQGKSATVAAKK